MKCSEHALNVLTLKSFKGIGNAWIRHHCKGQEKVSELVGKVSQKLGQNISEAEFQKKRDTYLRLLQNRLRADDGLVAWGDPHFPRPIGQASSSELPAFFYVRGNIQALLSETGRQVSVIGLTSIDPDISRRERLLVKGLASQGATVVSGLALGCDAVAHLEALNQGARTVAFLPSPLHAILPVKNRGLAERIVESGGLLATEYGRDAGSFEELRRRYYERDRLQALFCHAIILVASHAVDSRQRHPYLKRVNSGARLAMAFAKRYGVARAVLYDEETDCNNPVFDLNRQLLRDEGVIALSTLNLDEGLQRIFHSSDQSSLS